VSDINRRDALKAFAVVSVASFLDVGAPQLERTIRAVESLEQGQQYAPKFFSRHEWQTVRLLVDYVIPRDTRSGSATDAKVPEFMDVLLADKDASEASKISMRGGLAWLDNEARSRFSKTFVNASDAQRRQILDDIAWPKKASAEMSHGVAFFTRFRDLTASGFFSTAAGWRDVQYIGNVFNPNWNGCPSAALEKLGVSYDLMKSSTSK
jgi:gluconate 2-dehydrogenase gamma chain